MNNTTTTPGARMPDPADHPDYDDTDPYFHGLDGSSEKMVEPARIQRKRTKGWTMPPNTVSVTRPGNWGNPFTVQGCRDAGFTGDDKVIAARCVEAFKVWLTSPYWRNNWDGEESAKARDFMLNNMSSLRGKNLACFCPLDQPCHADVLLRIANDAGAE